MPVYRSTLGGERFAFDGLAALLAAATPARSGDALAGIAAQTEASGSPLAMLWPICRLPRS